MLMEAIPGEPGVDYPILSLDDVAVVSAQSGFSCQDRENGGYYADQSPESRCQVFHICGNNRGFKSSYSFLCPNGTIFNQLYFICDWWFNVDCQKTFPISAPATDASLIEPVPSAAASSISFVKLDTIYSAIRAANEKYESKNSRQEKSFDEVLKNQPKMKKRKRWH